MKKKLIFSSIIILLIVLFVYNNFNFTNGKNTFPSEVLQKEHFKYNITKPQDHKKSLFILFDVQCGSCSFTLEELNKNPVILSNYNIYIISENKFEEITVHLKELKLSQSNFFLITDHIKEILSNFDLGLQIVYPTIFLYNENRKFIKEIKNIDDLKRL